MADPPQPNVFSGGSAALSGTFWGLIVLTGIGAGAPGGLVTPTLTFGALLGAIRRIRFGHLSSIWWPGAPLGSYAIIGAAALWAASQGAVSASC